jgi:Protein of unknown function (DUF1553)/Protein of unknown function (DUF1549)/Planctomycete cytochrome C
MARVRRALFPLLPVVVLAAAAFSAPMPAEQHPTREGTDFFEKKIRPIFVKHCYECHSGDVKKAKGSFVLDTREGLRKGGQSGSVIIPGNPEESPLIEAIRYQGLEMPPKEQLPEELIDELVRWVEMGAPDPRSGKAAKSKNKIDLAEARKYWAFQRPKAVPAPKVHETSWQLTEIDRFLQAAREKEKVKPVADADQTTLIRRVTFDLTGLPPTPEEIDAFVNDKSAGALATVVDRLLASPRFGERWGRHWLDVVRYGESTGKERNIPYRYAWRYRDYVIDAFNADEPYDKFIVEQIAGDLLQPKNSADHDRLLIATGFLAIGTKGVNTKDAEQFRYDVIDDQIDVTGRAFLGMTVACARCHDHKYDPIPTSDYYAMAGIFHSSETLDGVKANRKSATDKDLLILSPSGKYKSAELSSEQKARQEEMAKLDSQLEALKKEQRGALKAAQPPRKKGAGKPAQPAASVAMQPADMKKFRDERKKLVNRMEELEAAATPVGDFAMGVREGEPGNSKLLVRGELKEKGEEVPRGVLTVLKTPQGNINPKHSGRLELAHWIAARENPLTARVMVNRVWLHLFGQALVPSTDNFGALGDEPTHPELLDYLALQFVNEHKWSVKKLIRSIVLTRSYQLSSEHNADDYAVDPSNKYLWRMERRRLEAEEIRDAMLAASGQLDLERPDGSPVMELANGQLKGGRGLGDLNKPANYRSVYLPVLRGNVPEMLQVFDAADPSLITGKRDVTTVATQALFLMNNTFVLKQSELLAKRILEPKGLNPAQRVDLVYRLALGRLPSSQEKQQITDYLDQYKKSVETAGQKGASAQLVSWASVCQILFGSGEFRYVY